MARTLNGNCTGTAARIEAEDGRDNLYRQEQEARAARNARTDKMAGELMDIIGVDPALNLIEAMPDNNEAFEETLRETLEPIARAAVARAEIDAIIADNVTWRDEQLTRAFNRP